ncbi:MAG: Conserved secreted protein of unknown function, putative domain [Blastococcus sp.]|nr:Conserved secreted protein of unknown function, putative domain [Blastococcus sp.]
MGDKAINRPRRALAGLVSGMLVAGVLGLVAPAAARADSAPVTPSATNPVTVAADGLPTVQINGVVWSQVVVGNTVYAAGSFTRSRPAGAAPGTQETVRNNLLAYDIRTGELVSSFAPDLNAQAMVVTASPDGSRVYVGGDFTRANGQVRNRIAAYDTRTGALVPNFAPSANAQVRAIAATNSTVYFGGSLSAVGSVSRTRLAAVRASDGGLLPWAPTPGVGPSGLPWNRDGNTATSNTAMALVVTGGGSQVVAAGRWDTMGGVRATAVTGLDPVTGANRGYAINTRLTNQGVNSAVYSLSTDGTNVYGTAYDYYGPGNLEGSFSVRAADGAVNWVNSCAGDTYNSFPMGGVLYQAGHPHYCPEIGGFPEQSPRINKFATALSLAPVSSGGAGKRLYHGPWRGTPAPGLLTWVPSMPGGTYTKQNQAAWSVSGNGQYLVYGGEFPRINGVGQQGLVRFAVPSAAPNRLGPEPGPGLDPEVTSTQVGTVRVGWRATDDPDNGTLTYRVTRSDRPGAPVFETTANSTFWNRPTMGFVDTAVTPGAQYTYRVTASDPYGNVASGSPVTVTAIDTNPAGSTYATTVRSDSPVHYWRMEESTSGRGADQVGFEDLLFGPGVTTSATGALGGGVASRSMAFNGTEQGTGAMTTHTLAPTTMSVEGWFTTQSRTGGVLIDFSDLEVGLNGGDHDRIVGLDDAGRLTFSVWPGAGTTITGPRSYNDGAWHHVVATHGPAGLTMYVDGALVASRADVRTGQATTGVWRIGGDGRWVGSSDWFNGRMDEVAVYGTQLTAAQVQRHYNVGRTGIGANTAPEASFTASATGLTVQLDGRASVDRNGTISRYSWSLGDGASASGPTASHTYARAGTYPVTLTVTDDAGATATAKQSVTVTQPAGNEAPTAAFTAASDGLTVTLNGSGSADSDGTIRSHAWTFGDGTDGTGATTSHTYAAEGSYPVQLTVTDDDGATAVSNQTVTVTAPGGPPPLARDTFQRTVSGGLGTADVGGPWTASSGATRLSVSPGTGTVSLPAPGNMTGAYLGQVSQTSADLMTSVSLSSAPTGGGVNLSITGRRVAANQEYRARLRFLSNGSVAVAFIRLAGTSAEALIGSEVVVPGLTYTPGTTLQVRVGVTGTGTTQLAATVWTAGSAEPATPTLTRTDTTASLQAAGGVGVLAYLSGSATAGNAVRFTSFEVRPGA